MPQPKNDFAFLRKWEKERKENKLRFAIRIGLLQYAIPIVLIVIGIDFLRGIEDMDQYLLIRIYWGLPVCVFCGLFAGWWMYRNNEKRYKSLKGLDEKKGH
ncbi:hypothetical protein C3K47_03420 [Solitalea longa]|uniref:Uncharacterized protein n=1 Tax=Solitalea longa TaxID=2079460 RepID=A0A2S5A877_9SPHI|nr:hypothetical protein [Solitalea longa]POY38457.1 hypothetical protein C3K47_03420 [Solitalea longa]